MLELDQAAQFGFSQNHTGGSLTERRRD
jgi:hypothetical protein